MTKTCNPFDPTRLHAVFIYISIRFKNKDSSKTWFFLVFKVGKYQTPGGAAFQKGTVCTIATYDPYSDTEGGGDIGRSQILQNKQL